MKIVALIFAFSVIFEGCDSEISNSSCSFDNCSAVSDLKLFPNLREDNLFASFLKNNLSQSCSDDLKSLLKALNNFEFWALKSMKNAGNCSC